MRVTKQKLIDEFNKIPNPNDPDYTILLRDCVVNLSFNIVDTIIIAIIDDASLDLKIRFDAYYSASIFFRRYEHHTRLIKLVDDYFHLFSSFALNNVVLSLYYKFKSYNSNISYFERAIEYAHLAVKQLNTNAGVLQNYSELVATALDEGANVSPAIIDKAIHYMDNAMLLVSSYPKHYCTKGRLQYWKKDYKSATENIRKAIDLENKDNKDAMIRIGQYYYYLLNIKTKESLDFVNHNIKLGERSAEELYNKSEEKNKQIIDELDKMKSKYLEFLAFFSSILAFIISTINIVSKYSDFNVAAGLIITFAGALTLSFGIFRLMILYNNDKNKFYSTFLVVFVSGLMIILGLLIGNNFFMRWI